jgi:hypothetical protein
MYSVFIYENWRVKPVEVVLKRGRGDKESNEAGKSETYCKHTCRYHNLSPIQILYAVMLKITIIKMF